MLLKKADTNTRARILFSFYVGMKLIFSSGSLDSIAGVLPIHW